MIETPQKRDGNARARFSGLNGHCVESPFIITSNAMPPVGELRLLAEYRSCVNDASNAALAQIRFPKS